MVSDGLIVLLLGMSVVFAFLMALTALISLLSRILRNHALEEEKFLTGEAHKKQQRRKAAAKRQQGLSPPQTQSIPGSPDPQTITAVISAALTLHRRR